MLISFLVIAIAELGDKTQLLVLGFVSRYPLTEVIGAVSAATAVLMLLAVAFGGAINYYLPAFYVQLFAGALFILFGLWTLFGKEEEEGAKKVRGNPFWVIFSTFFLAELGDKTQLATFALSAEYGNPWQVWLGATLGMAGINVLAALAGKWIKRFLPERSLKWLGAAIFIIFGLITLGGLLI
ncbi:MAG: TMEM165/GDT1 family protein [Candidatus Margulisiibacteriota bacterium]